MSLYETEMLLLKRLLNAKEKQVSQPASLKAIEGKRHGNSVTRFGNYLDFGQLFKAFGSN